MSTPVPEGRDARGTGSPAGAGRFPDPYEIGTPPGAEDWRDLYPYYSLFQPWRRAVDSAKTWFHDAMHFPEPMPPFDLVTADSAYMSTGAMNARVFALPPALGLDARCLNGYVYIHSLSVADPEEIERRTEEFAVRVGHYYRNWSALYEAWKTKVIGQIEALKAITLPALGEYEPIEHVTAGRGLTEAHDLLAAYQAVLASLDAVWNLHSEMLNMGYAAYLNFLTVVRGHFPEIADGTVAAMVGGIDVLLFRPDDELKRLARKAIELGISEIVSTEKDFDSLKGSLTGSAEGRAWLREWQISSEPWFHFSYGNGFYHHHRSWSDDPTLPLGMVGEYIRRLGAGETLERPRQRIEAERDTATAQYRALIPEGPLRGAFDDALGLSRLVFPYVENHNFYVEHWYMTEFWRTMRGFGSLFVRFGFVEQTDDVFFLRRTEIAEAIADLQLAWSSGGEGIGPGHWPGIVAERRRILDVLRRWTPPPALGPASEVVVEPMTIMLWGITEERIQGWLAAGGGPVNRLEGFAGSPGVAEGPARVVRSPDELDDLQEGEILIAPTTSPSWTPLFARMRAAVSDIGGIMCHAAIVSREYGLPAVVGTGNATSAIRTGQWVRVDGSTGVVTILDGGHD